MQFLMLLLVGCMLFAFSLVSLLNRRVQRLKQYPRLPGPTLLPFIGRIHDLPIRFMWLKFKEWADIYGPMYKTSMMGVDFVIVSDEQIAEDLLVKRAKTNSDRPSVRSLFDSKHEYLPMMGRNRKSIHHHHWYTSLF